MIHKSDPGSAATGTAETEQVSESLDMSMGTVPQEWHNAQDQAPTQYGDYGAISRAARFDVIPTGPRESTFVANAAAVAASLMSGTTWYLMDVVGIYSGPWLAPLVGLAIALTIRIASNAEAAYRAVLSVASYLLTLMVILIVLTHRDLTEIYQSIDNFQVYETTLVRTRLQDPLHVGAYFLGAFLSAQIGYFRSKD